MARADLNLLVTLDVLLAEGSVAAAARRLRLSPSAMSRALARLRKTMGDPLLVRAGRGLVPTPRAVQIREEVAELVERAAIILRSVRPLEVRKLVRTFTLRTSDGFVENFAPALLARLARDAPGVRLRFVPKLEKDSALLRDGSVDLETGVVGGATGPEIRTRILFRDRFIGVSRAGHPLSRGRMTLPRYAAATHLLVARRGIARGPVDEALALLGAARDIVTTVGGYGAALMLARSSDLLATVPERHTRNLREGMHSFVLPFEVPRIAVSMLWHPRMDADPAHRWLRERLLEVCTA